MARIVDTEIDRLKIEIALERLAEGMGIVLKRHGADLLGLCPFHDDTDPSLVISPKNNLWHCLGACQCGGSVIDWVMKAEGVSFRHAVELLLEDYQPLAASSSTKKSTVRKLPTALTTDAEDAKLLNQVVDYYHNTLTESPEALAYLEKRGLSNPELITQFKIGFANRTLGYRLPAKNRKEGASIRGQLQRLGLYRSSSHEHFTGSIVVPVLAATGQVTEIYGRKINDNLRKGTPTHLYLPGSHKGIWNVESLLASKEIILCESLIDAMTFWCAGFRNVTASYGIEGFTSDHLAAFKTHGIERILIAYDRDEAGNNAAEKLSKQLNKEGIDSYRILFPKNMDANSYALQVQPSSKSLGVVIRSAQWLGKGESKPITTTSVEVDAMDTLVAELETTVSEIVVNDTNAPPPLVAEEPETILPAAVVPAAPKENVDAEITEREVIIPLGDRRYRIRGLEKNLAFDVMKVNLLVSSPAFDGVGENVHVDTFDLYQHRPRGSFIKQSAIELGVKEDIIKHDLGRVLLKLEHLQEQQIRSAQSKKDIVLDDD